MQLMKIATPSISNTLHGRKAQQLRGTSTNLWNSRMEQSYLAMALKNMLRNWKLMETHPGTRDTTGKASGRSPSIRSLLLQHTQIDDIHTLNRPRTFGFQISVNSRSNITRIWAGRITIANHVYMQQGRNTGRNGGSWPPHQDQTPATEGRHNIYTAQRPIWGRPVEWSIPLWRRHQRMCEEIGN